MATRLSKDKPFSIAILAIGGQGGGVLTSWLVRLAESHGWHAQSTSVPGVAQRTGATLYHIEMIPRSERQPVLSLMSVPGQVDLVVAAEFSEIGRALQRGLVTPGQTVLIGSTHRSLAIAEKSSPASAEVDLGIIEEAGRKAAKKFYVADMEKIAEQNNSAISAVLFGAIAGSGATPFERPAFEDAIRNAGVGVAESLSAFSAGFDAIEISSGALVTKKRAAPDVLAMSGGSDAEREIYEKSCQRITSDFPPETRLMFQAGLNRVVDFHDAHYGRAYVDRISGWHDLDREAGGAERRYLFTQELAKYLATAMAYQDVIRVADLKIRASRFDRIRTDAGAKNGQNVKLTEFMHPRVEEICGLLPAQFGKKAENSKTMSAIIRTLFVGGKRIRTDTIFGFLVLYALSGLRGWRLRSLRHEIEMAHIDNWLAGLRDTLPENYDLAVEIVRCQRLIKGYSDTHQRSQSKFGKVMSGIDMVKMRDDAADWARRLRDAALVDADGDALDGVLKTIASFAQSPQDAEAS
jgi:indolepyruvate ferredoxin oxidoreductase beta subunit